MSSFLVFWISILSDHTIDDLMTQLLYIIYVLQLDKC